MRQSILLSAILTTVAVGMGIGVRLTQGQGGTTTASSATNSSGGTTVEVRSRGTQATGMAPWGSRAEVVSAGFESAVHVADVRITGVPGGKVKVRLEGGVGHDKDGDALLRFGSVTLRPDETREVSLAASGEATGELISSDVMMDLVIHADQAQATVEEEWDNNSGEDRWQETPDNPPPAHVIQTHRIVLKRGSTPVDGHLVGFYMEAVTYTDEQGNSVCVQDRPYSPGNVSDWADFVPRRVRTDYQGVAVATMIVQEQAQYFSDHLYDYSTWRE